MTVQSDHLWRKRLDIPAYRVGEAASYAQISPQTVVAWHKKKPVKKRSILKERRKREGLSFLQLIELAVVAEMRKVGVKLSDIEEARRYFKETTGLDHPFAQLRFKTDGVDIFRDIEGPLGTIIEDKLVAANHGGQFTWTEMLTSKFEEFNYGADGAVVAWKVAGVDKDIEINPKLAFGSPQIHGVRTAQIKSRWTSGEEVDEIAEDFSLSPQQVMEALLFEGLEPSDPRLARWMN